MLSSNLSLRKAYFAQLNTIQYLGNPVPVFWGQLPTSMAPGVYIIFGEIRHNDSSNKSASVTSTSVTVSIYTNSFKYNNGEAVELVANEVLNRIYNTPQFNISLSETFFQVIKTRLTSDSTRDLSDNMQNCYVDRTLIFNHTIFQNVS